MISSELIKIAAMVKSQALNKRDLLRMGYHENDVTEIMNYVNQPSKRTECQL